MGPSISLCLPYLHSSITAGRCYLLPIRRPGQRPDCALLLMITQDKLIASHTPDLHSSVITTARQQLSVGRPGYRFRLTAWNNVANNECACSSLPDLNPPVLTGRGQARSIGRPRPPPDNIRVAAIRQ